jgi:hypothetical protein
MEWAWSSLELPSWSHSRGHGRNRIITGRRRWIFGNLAMTFIMVGGKYYPGIGGV